MEKRRVVITGMGTVNPIGNSVAESWQGTGFSDYTSFLRNFREKLGISPRYYRENSSSLIGSFDIDSMGRQEK